MLVGAAVGGTPGCVAGGAAGTPDSGPSPIANTQSIGQRYEYASVRMGARCRIVVEAADEAIAASAVGAAFDRIAALEKVLSDYDQGSEVARLVRGPVGVWQPASADLIRTLDLSRAVHAASGGAFDITVGPLTRQWRDARRAGVLPAPEALHAALDAVGLGRLEWQPKPASVRVLRPEMGLDFGGIGKGLAADAAAEVLRSRGLQRFLVDFGGDLLAGEAPTDSPEGWRVEVRDGVSGTRAVLLRRAAIATSGDLEQSVEIAGTRYSHLVDPATGLGLTTRVAATVIADAGWKADALASAACVIGPDRARLEALRGAFGDEAVTLIDVRSASGDAVVIGVGTQPIDGELSGQ